MSDKITPELYVDGALEIGLIQGMVRMDLFSVSATRKTSAGQPEPELRQRLVMHPQAFLQTYAMMQDMLGRMEKAGMIVRRADGMPEAPENSAASAPSVEGTSSPNF